MEVNLRDYAEFEDNHVRNRSAMSFQSMGMAYGMPFTAT